MNDQPISLSWQTEIFGPKPFGPEPKEEQPIMTDQPPSVHGPRLRRSDECPNNQEQPVVPPPAIPAASPGDLERDAVADWRDANQFDDTERELANIRIMQHFRLRCQAAERERDEQKQRGNLFGKQAIIQRQRAEALQVERDAALAEAEQVAGHEWVLWPAGAALDLMHWKQRAEAAEQLAERLRVRLHDQTNQTQITAQQCHDRVTEKLRNHDAIPDGITPGEHPIEQVVGTCVFALKCRAEAAEMLLRRVHALAPFPQTKLKADIAKHLAEREGK